MKTKSILATLILMSAWFCAPFAPAADIVVTNSGNWSSTVPDAPWPDGIIPGAGDDVEVDSPGVITVDTSAEIQFIYGDGAIIMAPGSTLNVVGDPAGGQGTFQLATLDASAPGNTIIYSGNPFWAKKQDYYNLIFSNTVAVNPQDFYNGFISSQNPGVAMTVAGDMMVIGKIKVQMGNDFTIGGNLLIGTNASWDCSSFYFTVASNVTVGGLLLDGNGALGSNYVAGNLTVTAGALGWNISDVTHWALGGSLTNDGTIVGKGYGRIIFDGAGTIAGSKTIKIPTMTVNGTYAIANTLILATNTPDLNGTVIFDLARTNQIVLQTYPANPLTNYYGGNLNVINSGPPPTAGNSYQLFVAGAYDGAFASSPTFPSLGSGLTWGDHLLTSGSISVDGSVVVPPPTITSSQYNPVTHQITVTWTSVPSVTYSILSSSNLSSGFNTVLATGIPSGGNSTTNTVTMPNGNAGFVRIRQP